RDLIKRQHALAQIRRNELARIALKLHATYVAAGADGWPGASVRSLKKAQNPLWAVAYGNPLAMIVKIEIDWSGGKGDLPVDLKRVQGKPDQLARFGAEHV